MAELTPTKKVQAGIYSGAATIVAVYLLQQLGIDLPPTVAAAVTTLFAGLGAYLKTEGLPFLPRRKRGKYERA